jgi:ABC-2 type transport system permease protein
MKNESLLNTFRRNLRATGALAYYIGVLPMLRIPTLLPFVFATPFTILFILFVAGQRTAFAYGLAGAITMTATQQGLFLGADLTGLKIDHKFQSMVVASPVSPFTYMFSVALSELAFAAPAVFVITAIVAYTTVGFGLLALLEMILVIILTWVMSSSIGFFLSTYVLNTRSAFITVSFISIVLSILPPVFYPVTTLPVLLRPVAELIPTTHAANLIRSVMGISPSGSQILVSWLALPAFTLAFLLLALLKAKWRES